MNATNGSTKLAAPQRGLTDLAYDTDCKAALEPLFNELIDKAVDAGWDRRKTAYALMFLASRNVTGSQSESRTV